MSALCALADLANPGAAGFVVEKDGSRLAVLVARRGRKVFGWVNSCPHLWVPLDTETGRFLSLTGEFILCGNHGALFEIDSGACVLGPCRGKGLTPYPVTVRDGMVVAAGGCFSPGTCP